ncbi:MAG: DNA mismatch repair endonuclease MutL [Lachnospiraceae bacterium]|nr:DNA mismatch repair endonuclease MutL [Lachnospiraceae bacterium]
MQKIHILDQDTINQIAAGEVIERPSSVVKELTENAIDAGASAVTVEIRDGGKALIRVTDNGSGFDPADIRTAFMPHATSKIRTAEDLFSVGSLGFRGEALPSVASVSKTELITRTAENITGIRYINEGGTEKEYSEVGAPEGTTIIIRELFYNTPARKKFLKKGMTEASNVCTMMERLALSHPSVSMRLIVDDRVKLNTPGNGRLKDLVYSVYGKDAAASMIPVNGTWSGVEITGFTAKPEYSRANRTSEIYFVNNRFVKNPVIGKAIENAYQGFLMQHRYPVCILFLQFRPGSVDVNVHPAKLEIRFSDEDLAYQAVYEAVREALSSVELIKRQQLVRELQEESRRDDGTEPFFAERRPVYPYAEKRPEKTEVRTAPAGDERQELPPVLPEEHAFPGRTEPVRPFRRDLSTVELLMKEWERTEKKEDQPAGDTGTAADQDQVPELSRPSAVKSDVLLTGQQERLFTAETRKNYRVIGQLFDTYWLFEYNDTFLMMDQHAAHEKVLYERNLAAFRNKEFTSQMLMPPFEPDLGVKEMQMFSEHIKAFRQLGFEFGNADGKLQVTAVPGNVLGLSWQEIFKELLDSVSGETGHEQVHILEEKLALMSCKAAIKGNYTISNAEINTLLDELLQLDNPYMCPHGRPTLISMSKYEIEKRFSRIV